jgi:hypothetical protein
MAALCLTACAAPVPETVIPPELLRPVAVECRDGGTLRALGQCAMNLRQGLDEANAKLVAVGEIVGPQ